MTAEQWKLITSDPEVMHGQAVLAGTRVPVSVILDCLAAGMAVEDILAEYPGVTEEAVRAAAAYGAALAREELVPIPPTRDRFTVARSGVLGRTLAVGTDSFRGFHRSEA